MKDSLSFGVSKVSFDNCELRFDISRGIIYHTTRINQKSFKNAIITFSVKSTFQLKEVLYRYYFN